MFSHLSVFLITSTNVLASSFITTTTPSATPLARRQNAAHVPTFTFRPNSEYFPTSAGNPEPSGTSLQVYPTGSWERFPDEGITVALGPELRGQIKDAVEKSCGDASTQQCRDALTPLLQSSEVTQHVKRFVPFLPFVVGIGIALVLNLLLGTAGVSRNGPPQEIKLNNVDLAQIQTLGGASTIAVVSDGAAPSTVSFAPAVTTTTP